MSMYQLHDVGLSSLLCVLSARRHQRTISEFKIRYFRYYSFFSFYLTTLTIDKKHGISDV